MPEIVSWGELQAQGGALARDILGAWRDYSVAYWIEARMYAPDFIEERFAAKYRSWQAGRPRGTIAHYTGGPDGVLSAIWLAFNRSNDGSSCHGTFLQNHHPLAESMLQDAALLKRYLPTPVLQHGNLDVGKWGATWTNDTCLQFEVESLGLLDGACRRIVRRTHYEPATGCVRIGLHRWQKWRYDVLVSWVNLHRAIATVHGALAPEWVLPHSAVQLAKSDAGLAFPIEELRELICVPEVDDERTAVLAKQIARHPGVTLERPGHKLDLAAFDVLDLIEEEQHNLARHPRAGGEGRDSTDYTQQGVPAFVCRALRALGYYCPEHDEEGYGDFAVRTFQRASRASDGWGNLAVDGVAGKQTLTVLHRKLNQMGLVETAKSVEELQGG
jgi:hypothetical protein